jgi:steroid 5-alpha reductase family enzyme
MDWATYLQALAVMTPIAVATWVASVVRRDVSIIDSVWSLMILAGATVHLALAPAPGARSLVVATLLALWALRLSAHITWRNRGRGEDRRYAAIRARNEPGFALKSLYLVFVLQSVLAWIVLAPAAAAISSPRPLAALDLVAAIVVLSGLAFETVADAQLARFAADPGNRGRVMDRGLWRYSRHPNYFGEFCLWWGFWLFAVAAGAWWTMPGPILLSVLLLRVSGVALLEADIAERRPAYRRYVASTNAFFPGPPRNMETRHA